MSQNNELKDLLYYTDLIYEIKKLAGFEQTKNEETEKRIIEREKCIVEKQIEGPFEFLNRLSDFQQELFEIIMGISQKAGVVFRGLQEISKYPELVKEVLEELENKVSGMKSGVTANEVEVANNTTAKTLKRKNNIIYM